MIDENMKRKKINKIKKLPQQILTAYRRITHFLGNIPATKGEVVSY